MAASTTRFERWFPMFVLVGLVLICFVSFPDCASAQSSDTQTNPENPRAGQFSRVVLGPVILPSPTSAPKPQTSRSGTGITILPAFDSSIDMPTQNVITSAITFYQNTITNSITINIFFYKMSGGLGLSTFFTFPQSYQTYCNALAASATSPDDTTAIAQLTPCGANNPVNAMPNIDVKSPTGLALGLNTPEQSFNFTNSPCPTFTGSGCIGINVTQANNLGVLLATVEHEIDEVLGLGSALESTTTPTDPWPEDLFRWTSAGTRIYSANSITGNPCGVGAPAAFFSIDGGNTNLDNFNNCDNGGDYGDWIEHTPPQVQDAFIGSTTPHPSLTATSPEVRALDVIGFNLVGSKHRRGQLVSQ